MTVEEFYVAESKVYEKALKYVHFYLDMIQVDTGLSSRIETRLKTCPSLKDKCKRKNVAPRDIEEKITDIAGARVICKYPDWIPELVSEIKKIPNLTVVKYKDYIEEPKANGYAGYHLYCKINIPTREGNRLVWVEIQIRTLPQDNWATIEHEHRYKAAKAGAEIGNELIDEKFRQLAQACAEIDKLNREIRDLCESTKRVEEKEIKEEKKAP